MVFKEYPPLLLLLLLVVVAAQDDSSRHVRHPRNYNKIFENIRKLSELELRGSDDEEIDKVVFGDELSGDLDESDEDFDDEFDDEEDEQAKVPGVSDPKRSHQHASNEDVEDEDFAWDHSGEQADATWIYYGTREQLEKSKPIVKLKQKEINEALKHNIRMIQEGVCKYPQKRVVSIQDIYPDASKIYTPHCTILHKCGDDTGCCKTDMLNCVSKSFEIVELYFHVSVVGRSKNIVEKLSFVNHTECECVPRGSELMIKDETSFPSLRSGPTFHNIINNPEIGTEISVPLIRCQCPREFSPQTWENEECECDCANRQRSCMSFKRGKEHFSLSDRQCIRHGLCEKPKCEFGEYDPKIGRCPKRNEKFDKSSPDHIKMVGNA